MYSLKKCNFIITTGYYRLLCGRKFFINNSSNIMNNNNNRKLERSKSSSSPPPGPNRIQMIWNLMPPFGKWYNLQLIDFYKKIREEYGLIVKIPGSYALGSSTSVIRYSILLFDPNDWQLVFHNDGQCPYRKSVSSFTYYRNHLRLAEYFNNTESLLTSNGKKWYELRRCVNPIMLQPKSIKQYISNVDKVALDFIEYIKLVRNGKTNEMPKDFHDDIYKWALESISTIALNKRLGLFEKNSSLTGHHDEQSIKFNNALRKLFQLSYELDVSNDIDNFTNKGSKKLLRGKKFKEFLSAADFITINIMKYIDMTLKDIQQNNQNDNNGVKSILEKLLHIDRYLAISISFDMLFAGVDTTATALIGCLYRLAKHPQKQERLRIEILKLLHENSQLLTENSLIQIPYLRACLKESMRLMPVNGQSIRTTTQSLQIKNYLIPKGTDILMPHILLQNMNENYVDAEKFIPERWLRKLPDNQIEMMINDADDDIDKCLKNDILMENYRKNPYIYLPFGYGSRSCIGQRFAEMEIYILLIRILSRFRIEWNHADLEYTETYLNIPINDLKFTMIDYRN